MKSIPNLYPQIFYFRKSVSKWAICNWESIKVWRGEQQLWVSVILETQFIQQNAIWKCLSFKFYFIYFVCVSNHYEAPTETLKLQGSSPWLSMMGTLIMSRQGMLSMRYRKERKPFYYWIRTNDGYNAHHWQSAGKWQGWKKF